MAPHSSTLAWKIPWMEEPGRLQSMGSLRVGHGWATSFSLFTFMHWRRKWQPTPVFLPGESQGRGSLIGSMGSHRAGHDWSNLAGKLIHQSLSHLHYSFLQSLLFYSYRLYIYIWSVWYVWYIYMYDIYDLIYIYLCIYIYDHISYIYDLYKDQIGVFNIFNISS